MLTSPTSLPGVRTPYEPFVAYGRSKTANILFAVAFDKRHRSRGVRAAEGKSLFQFKTIPQDAATSVWAAVVAPADEVNGQLLRELPHGKIVPGDVTIAAVSEGVRSYALDPKNAEALWKKGEEMVAESF